MQGLVPGVTCPMILAGLLCGVVDAKRIDIDATLENDHSFSTSLLEPSKA